MLTGLYTAPPGTPGAEFVELVEDVSADVIAMAGAPVSGMGSGGMVTKIEAARIATGAGAAMVITAGHEDHPLQRILSGGRATWFTTTATPATARKRWIAGSLDPAGSLVVDEGAVNALMKGRSLLPAGIKTGAWQFQPWRYCCHNVTETGSEIARGLVAYDANDATTIAGRKSSEIAGCWVWQAAMKWFTVMIW
jgi:glutamate 5-kinase